MNKLFLATIVTLIVVVAFGCDNQPRTIAIARDQYKLTPEVQEEQTQNRGIVKEMLNKYRDKQKKETGQANYPASLEELKKAGFDYPEPSEGWQWDYQLVTDTQYILVPSRKVVNLHVEDEFEDEDF